MSGTASRVYLDDFALANPLYRGAPSPATGVVKIADLLTRKVIP